MTSVYERSILPLHEVCREKVMDSQRTELEKSWYFRKHHPRRQPVYQAVIDVSNGFSAITFTVKRPALTEELPTVLNLPAVIPPSDDQA